MAAAALVVAAVFFVNDQQTPPAQAQAAADEVWSATLTVGQASFGRGYLNTGTVGTLSPDTFTHDGVSYQTQRLIFNPGNGNLQLFLNKAIPNDLQRAGILTLGDSEFALAGATIGTTGVTANAAATWANAGLSWAAGDTVQVRLTDPPITLTASMSTDPVNEDWETNSAHDLWSPTLTVRDLGTTGSAPAKVGCDDSNSSARCSSALTRRDFTFDGVRYTVEAISYNQRKVAADIETFQVKTYEESLTLKLNKAIPKNLQSCLTLYAGDARIRLADDGIDGAGVDVVLSDSNRTITLTEISGLAWGLNWSAGQTVQLRLPNVGCLTLTLSAPVDEETSLQWRRGGTADSSDYQRISLPTFAAGTTSASTPVKPVDDSDAEGCETIILDMTMWPGTERAVHERFTVAIQDDDMPSQPCVGGG